ncbi:MAG: hypothetical protein EOM83_15285 [Clostridia bacterium]|nr:hypothetical protein [Clostridia bacterium]
MKKLFIGLILLNSSLVLFSQNIEVFGGLNQNTFFDFQKNEGHFHSSYNGDEGYAIGIGVDNIKVDKMTLRFTLTYDKYGGKIEASDGGLGGGYTTRAEIDKSILSLGFFPLNFRFFDRIDLNFGFEVSALVVDDFKGRSSGWMMGTPGWSYDLNEKYNRFSAKKYFGLRGRIAYDFYLTDKIAVSPQYSYYFGLSHEFDEFPEETKSKRHYLFIGIKRVIK